MKQLVWISVLMGCVSEPTTEPPKTPQSGTSWWSPNDWWDPEIQGRHVLGSAPDLLLAGNQHFRVSNLSASPGGWTLSVTTAGLLGANGANLIATDANGTTHEGADTWFKDPFGNGSGGLTMNGSGGRPLRIRDVAVDGTSAIYYLDIFDPLTGEWTDYCGGAGGAFALHGGFNARRIHTMGPTISFACDDGVGKKCIGWGYVPGTGGPGNIDWDHHQACIQMANAAYCGGAQSGLPFTREETPIVIRDFRKNYAMSEPMAAPALTHPAVFPGDPDVFYFEAAWRPNGRAPLCLSKLRWKTLPPNPCPIDLPDPRFDPNPEAKFCEDYSYADLKAMGALLVNGSQLMDAPIDKWRNPATNDVVTTMRGFYSNVLGDTSESIAPFPGYTEYVGPDGMILRNLTGTLDADVDMIELYIQHDTKSTRLVLSDGVDLPDHTHDLDGDFEGYAFKDPARVPELKWLKVCSSGGDYNTTINGCSSGSLAGPMYALPAP